MFHVNHATGETGQCRAHQGKCPFGTVDEHFGTRDAAEAHYGRAMAKQVLVTHRREPVENPVKLFPLAEELALKQALETGVNIAEAKESWERASIEYAATPEGLAYFQELEAGAELGSPGEALYQHFVAEGNRLRVSRMGADDLSSALFSAKRAPGAEASPAIPEPPIDWASMDPRAQLHGSSAYVSDLQEYQSRVDTFRANPAAATEEQVHAVLPAIRCYSDLRWSMPPRRTRAGEAYVMDSKEWKVKAEEGYAYGRELAEQVMAHPKATPEVFETVAKEYGAELAYAHPACPRKVREDYIAEKSGKIEEDLLPLYRDERVGLTDASSYGSNRVALYLAASDPDDVHRQEAFHQVVVADMDSFTAKDRLWMARNLDKFPTSEGTVDTLKHSLQAYARGFADQKEREKLLEALGDRVPVAPEEPRRGLFSRR